MRFSRLPALLAVGLSVAGAQQVMRKEPFQYAGPERASRVEARPPGMRLGLRKPREFALAPLSEAEAARLTGPSTRLKTGVQRRIAPHAFAAGTWETTSEGTRIWRLSVRSPRARGMRVEFDGFSVGDGRVWIYDGSHSAGPYSGRGPYGDGHFFSSSVYADSAVVEYEPAANAGPELEPPFAIRSIVHQVRTALDGTAGNSDPADYCELDANCYPDWKSAMSSVGQISFVEDGVEALCSGSLLATRDNSAKPYFLTAGHCVHDEATARTVQAYWNYQTSSCNGTPPSSRDAAAKSTLGAHLIASADLTGGDYSLILLQDVPSGVTFAGWDPGGPPVGGTVTAIHHPSGSWKRISFGTRTDDASVNVEGTTTPGNLYFQVLYSQGRVEHGSSGSPLFTSPGIVAGSLSNGEVLEDGSVCPINPQAAGYSRFSTAYPAVSPYLENLPATLVTPAKSALTFTMLNGAQTPAQQVQLTTQSSGQVTYKLRADAQWIQLGSITGTVSSKTPATVAISIDAKQLPQPGQYTSTVSILSGAAPPQYISVSAAVKVDQSNVVVTITPNPVGQISGKWSFTVSLAETAGAATHVTAAKFNGTDISSSLQSLFGGTAIGAKATLTAPVTTAGYPPGNQYFEFWGVDDTSGQPWYRTAVAVFQQ
ncbi:MAG TPA: trypsin-like peptidase domain-containing protein [Candidatus Acidoferrales bacterium]|nr:trypsin-like peptidase domain-containing protein [Candidatus Acidoferrales bacterium]